MTGRHLASSHVFCQHQAEYDALVVIMAVQLLGKPRLSYQASVVLFRHRKSFPRGEYGRMSLHLHLERANSSARTKVHPSCSCASPTSPVNDVLWDVRYIRRGPYSCTR